MGKTADYSHLECAVAGTLQIVGDPWTLLILSAAFNGVSRFEQWCERLGLARNVLAARLKSLVADGLMERRLYSARPERYEYVLTAKGQDAFPIIAAMRKWGNRHIYGQGNEPFRHIHGECGEHFEPAVHCAHCGEPAGPEDVSIERTEKTAFFFDIRDRRRG
jgi:DNA-binding HxlR family transcriptional regulator